MTRLELANQLIEGQPAFHFAFIPVMIANARGEIRTLTVLVLNQPPPAGWATRAGVLFDLILAEGFEPTKNKGLSFACLPIASREQEEI